MLKAAWSGQSIRMGEANVDVLDLDVSSYPDEAEEDEVDMKRRKLEEIAASPKWSAAW